MFVGTIRIEVLVPGAQSLKDKRQVVRSLKERIRHRTQASVAEVDHQDLWQRAALGVALVSGDRHHLGVLMQAVRQVVESVYGAQLIDWQEQVT